MTDDDSADDPVSRTRHPAQGETVSSAVVEAVAAVRGVDPLTLDQRLYEVVDPDALESLCDPGRSPSRPPGYVVFEMADCVVEVQFSGHVTARERTDRDESTP